MLFRDMSNSRLSGHHMLRLVEAVMSKFGHVGVESYKIGFGTVYSNNVFLRWLDMAALGEREKEATGTKGVCETMVRLRSPSNKPLGAGSYTKVHNCRMISLRL